MGGCHALERLCDPLLAMNGEEVTNAVPAVSVSFSYPTHLL